MLVFENAVYYTAEGFRKGTVTVSDGKVFLSPAVSVTEDEIDGKVILPGLADAHVHLREPGFFYKESIATGSESGARAGYTALFAMPNLNPVPDSLPHLREEQDAISRTAKTGVYPYAALTVGERGEELSAIEELAPHVIGFSDDGRGVQSEALMREAMLRVKACGKVIAAHKACGKVIAAHCEVNDLLRGGYIHDGAYARTHGHKGICSESEWKMVERDVALAEETGVSYHVCHVSAKESVEIIRRAKARGVDVTCETAPHYLLLTEDDLEEDGRFKMNPPIRTAEDRAALVEGLADGTVDMVATDHAPHSDEEKSRGLAGSLMGVIGLEFAFPVLYTGLVATGRISLHRLVEAMSAAPLARFGLPGGDIRDGAPADLAVFDLSCEWTVRGRDSASKGSSTPFEGMKVRSKNTMTILNGEIIWKE